MGYFEWPKYVSVAERRALGLAAMAKLKKKGVKISPVKLTGKSIATTFWGKAWCDHLENHRDMANRLERGRSLVRNGSVVDLQIATGKVTAHVQGSELYDVKVTVKPLAPATWKTIREGCAGGIDTLVELLQGKLSSAVMTVVTHPTKGLLPQPREMSFRCSCPDDADVCKHVAAALYGVGSRLDSQPELLFALRDVDPGELVADAGTGGAVVKKGGAKKGAKTIAREDLGSVFGIELEGGSEPVAETKTKKGRVKKGGATKR